MSYTYLSRAHHRSDRSCIIAGDRFNRSSDGVSGLAHTLLQGQTTVENLANIFISMDGQHTFVRHILPDA